MSLLRPMPDARLNVLVTGATGFIGQHLVPRLCQLGHNVHCLTRSDKAVFADLPVTKVIGDITSLADMESATRGMDVVYNLAGMVSYRSSDLAQQIAVNVGGVQNVMQACLQNKVPRVVHTSSVAAFGIPEPKGFVADENFVYNLLGKGLTYCDTKHQGELVVSRFFEQGLNVVMLNPGIIFGEGDSHAHHHAIFKSMSRGVLAVPSGGIPFSDINDVVDAHLNAITMGSAGERYSLVSANLSFADAAAVFASIYHCNKPLLELPDWLVIATGYLAEGLYALGLPTKLTRQQAWLSCQRIFFDSKKAARDLGFSPTPFKQTVERTASYYLKRV